MLRAELCSLFALAIIAVGVVRADDAKKKEDPDKHHMQATIAKVDSDKHTVAVNSVAKNGKEEEQTLQLAKDAKFLDSNGKDAKLESFKMGDNVCVTEKNGKVTELRKHTVAKITKVDEKAGTITVKMKDKDGKDVEKTFRLVEDSEYLDDTGRVAVLDVFQSGDDILFVEADGQIKGMKKADKAATKSATNTGKEKKSS